MPSVSEPPPPTTFQQRPPILIDVSRLIWRSWTGRLPTGIDRVCLAYIDHFGANAATVIQWKRQRIILAPSDSKRLIATIRLGGLHFRRRLVGILSRTMVHMHIAKPHRGQFYLNIGHTGLDDPGLGDWISRNGLRAIYLVHDLIPIDTPRILPGGRGRQACRTHDERVGECQRHHRQFERDAAGDLGVCRTQQLATPANDCGVVGRRYFASDRTTTAI